MIGEVGQIVNNFCRDDTTMLLEGEVGALPADTGMLCNSTHREEARAISNKSRENAKGRPHEAFAGEGKTIAR